ncbi:DUF4440 domain-containing protein [Pseudoalteromonas phenolica]|uniref:DUF4440 domain-containing protein n=1 Tax=Pseudoalteromonas phenolica TaxID=161398 RepID=A0A4Q7IJR6_9GAMM|nr:DUF4440 domain-containing protein [Pseudoalteromonas phenolica]RZQ51812.1 DUF4440 domain-containing protein [Pseudoalteromonas phenolica]
MDILITQEVALHQYEVRQNVSQVTRLLHPEFVEAGASGKRYDLQSILEMLAFEHYEAGCVHSQNFQCITVGHDSRLPAYKAACVYEGGKVDAFSRRASLWQQTEIGW